MFTSRSSRSMPFNILKLLGFTFVLTVMGKVHVFAQQKSVHVNSAITRDQAALRVHACLDFKLSGTGKGEAWHNAEWNTLTLLDSGEVDYASEFKILYSTTGIYLLFRGQDTKITTKDYADNESIFKGDVFEAFFHPNPGLPEYFEYEVNQMDKQLILMIGKVDGKGYSWIPWHNNPNSSTGIKKMVNVEGGRQQPGSSITSWSAEVFFPYVALGLLPNVPPSSGTTWNANFCRLDYDSGNMIKWSWSPTIETSFHELEKFRIIMFE